MYMILYNDIINSPYYLNTRSTQCCFYNQMPRQKYIAKLSLCPNITPCPPNHLQTRLILPACMLFCVAKYTNLSTQYYFPRNLLL